MVNKDWQGKTAWQKKALDVKPEDPSWNPRILLMEAET